jgi:hypothetical protein
MTTPSSLFHYGDTFNYTLNGIQHQISLKANLQIHQKPLEDKFLISQKFILKYIHDLFEIHSIDYFLVNHSLLGHYVFQGIHIFHPSIEICMNEYHLAKLKKIKEDIFADEFHIEEHNHYFILSSSFFSKVKVKLFIYILYTNPENPQELFHYLSKDKKIHQLYDIYPLQKVPYEEFFVYIPHKIMEVLQNYNFDINYIEFKENPEQKREIIGEGAEDTFEEKIQQTIFQPFMFIKNKFFQQS